MGKSAKFFKRPTRKEKAVLSLNKGTAESSLFDSAGNAAEGRTGGEKKSALSATANHTIAKRSSGSAAGGGSGLSVHPPKASLAYKMQLNGGIKQAVKDMKSLDEDGDEDLVSEDEDMEGTGGAAAGSKKKETLDKTQPRSDYVELMYGKPSGNKRKTFMPKPALIK